MLREAWVGDNWPVATTSCLEGERVILQFGLNNISINEINDIVNIGVADVGSDDIGFE